MLDRDDPMLCPDRHSEVEQAMHVAAVKAMVATARGLTLDDFEAKYPAPAVLDPHAGTSHLMVPRELMASIANYLRWMSVQTSDVRELLRRVDEVLS